MALVNFTGFKDAYSTTYATTLPTGLDEYVNGKMPCFKNKAFFMMSSAINYQFDGAGKHFFRFNNNLNEYGVFSFDVTSYVGDAAPVGATLTFGYLLNTSVSRVMLSGWFSTTPNSSQQSFTTPAATGDRYIELQLKKVSSTQIQAVSVVNGTTVETKNFATSIVSASPRLFIGFADGAISSGDRFGATNGTLSITDMYFSYNTDGQDEFLGRPAIARVGATVQDRGSWTNSNGTYTDQQIGDYSTKSGQTFLTLAGSTQNSAFALSKLGDVPIIFRGESYVPAAGTTVRAIQVTSFSKATDATIRTPQRVVLKDVDSGQTLGGRAPPLCRRRSMD
ncbi:hypothetical protein CL97_gp061 [Cronobacter phage CR9]|uniref:Uncharacterized protein n=1 Tax=Cronobacter phage CR9 TaxID=1162290 RepID=M1F3G8_9CAUD|nr:hypothetical protein CL97_gp061 [Cronobacter phage CR9]AFH20945.1 hypothetical protein CR9_061 [Cronobacter phage CR9]